MGKGKGIPHRPEMQLLNARRHPHGAIATVATLFPSADNPKNTHHLSLKMPSDLHTMRDAFLTFASNPFLEKSFSHYRYMWLANWQSFVVFIILAEYR